MKDRLIEQQDAAEPGPDTEVRDFLEAIPTFEPTDAELIALSHNGLLDAVRSTGEWLEQKAWRVRFYGEALSCEDLEFIIRELRRALRDFA